MNKKLLLQRIKELSVKGKLTCVDALRLADECGVSPKTVGQTANEAKIKICTCQLGCF
jgi:LAO/AO transport system kinase